VADRVVEDGAPTSDVRDDAITGVGAAALEVEPHPEPAAQHAVESGGPASPMDGDDDADLPAGEPGSSVADVLAGLEALYR
jgi:hypothetical protein